MRALHSQQTRTHPQTRSAAAAAAAAVNAGVLATWAQAGWKRRTGGVRRMCALIFSTHERRLISQSAIQSLHAHAYECRWLVTGACGQLGTAIVSDTAHAHLLLAFGVTRLARHHSLTLLSNKLTHLLLLFPFPSSRS